MLITVFKDVFYMHITSVLITQTEHYSSVILSSLPCVQIKVFSQSISLVSNEMLKVFQIT